MKNKKMLITILLITAIIGSIGLLRRMVHKKKSRFTIGILQTASHPALDASRDGFIAKLQKKLGSEVDFVIRNAEGSIPNAHTIAQHFHADSSIDAIFAIATPALQAIASVEKEKPIIFSAVTDPVLLGIIHPKTNICGSTDMIDVRKQIDAMQQLLPNVKTVAIIFNPAEINAVTLANQMVTELNHQKITPIKVGISTEVNIPQAVTSALRKADALLAPTDNMIASAITIIAQLARNARKPLIVSDNLLVKHGALMARGVDYHESGQMAAQMAIDILTKGKKPHELPLAHPAGGKIFINRQVLDELDFTIPVNLKPHIVLVNNNGESV